MPCVGAHTSRPGCWTTGLAHTEGVRDMLLVPRPSTDVGKRQRTALRATVMSDSLCSAGLWQGLVVTGEGEAPLVQEHFTGPTDGLSPRYLFILWPNTTTGFHLQLHFKTKNSRSAGVAAPALARWATRGGQLAGLLQEGPAAPHTLLVHSLEVGVVPVVGVLNNKSFFWIIAPK